MFCVGAVVGDGGGAMCFAVCNHFDISCGNREMQLDSYTKSVNVKWSIVNFKKKR